jgi:hypothetical protein
MRKSGFRWIIFAVLALAVMAARVNFTPAAQVSPAAVVQQQDTPAPVPIEPSDPDGIPSTGGETVDEVGERQAEMTDRGGNWPFLLLLGIAFLVVIIGLLTRARSHRFPR